MKKFNDIVDEFVEYTQSSKYKCADTKKYTLPTVFSLSTFPEEFKDQYKSIFHLNEYNSYLDKIIKNQPEISPIKIVELKNVVREKIKDQIWEKIDKDYNLYHILNDYMKNIRNMGYDDQYSLKIGVFICLESVLKKLPTWMKRGTDTGLLSLKENIICSFKLFEESTDWNKKLANAAAKGDLNAVKTAINNKADVNIESSEL